MPPAALLPLLALLERRPHESDGDSSNLLVVSIVAIAVVFAIFGRGLVHKLDKDRIAKYAADQGWELLSCQWRLFGPGWLGAGRSRFYQVVYRDGSGATRQAFARTSALAGVYLTQDSER